MHSLIVILPSLALLANAIPTQNHHHRYVVTTPTTTRDISSSSSNEITADQILTISPKSSSCDNPPAAGECATAADAAPHINDAFITYQIDSPAEQAALISLMAFESGDFKYNRNHFPGVPGQGTRNMQSPDFNKKYASSIPELKDRVAQASDASAVLDLLLSDEKWDFGSAAWFLTTQCTADQRQSLQSGSETGWETYISSCVGTTVTDDRKAYWTRAIEALGVNSS